MRSCIIKLVSIANDDDGQQNNNRVKSRHESFRQLVYADKYFSMPEVLCFGLELMVLISFVSRQCRGYEQDEKSN